MPQGTRYTTWGVEDGGCEHEHRTLRAAYRCHWAYHQSRAKAGMYCDRRIIALGPRRDLTSAEQLELIGIVREEMAGIATEIEEGGE